MELESQQVTRRILPAVAFTAVAYFSIGILLAILPTYARRELGVSPGVAGLLVSLQYIATFASRPAAGKLSDTIGPRQTVRYGMLAIVASGILLCAAVLLRHVLLPGVLSLVASRLALGAGESLSSTGGTMWGIGRVGTANTSRVISWNGVATYSALAISAPVGVAVESHAGFFFIGVILIALAGVSWVAATRMPATAPIPPQRASMADITARVSPYGLALALGGVGFGVIATFITLYFAGLEWQGAALCLTIYGTAFVGARLLFSGLIDRFGGYATSIVSLLVETVGLVVLGLVHSHAGAYIGCGLAGLGFSLVFPALGVEAANIFPAAVRGSVLGIYAAFIDFSLFLTGPLAGICIGRVGYPGTFLAVAGLVLVALAITVVLASTQKKPAAVTACRQ